jgi:PAS domain S-box-containing protein
MTASEALQGLPEAGAVRRAQIANFASQTPLNAAATTLTSLSAAGVMWHGGPRVAVLAWLLVHLVQAAFVTWRWYRRRDAVQRPTASVRALKRAALLATVSGLTWGSAVLLMQGLDELHRMAVLAVMSGMLAGGAMTLGAVPMAAGAFIAAIAVPTTTFFLLQGGEIYVVLAVLTVVYAVAMQGSAYIVYGALLRNLRAEQANTDLLRQFRAERTEWLDIAETAEAAALFDADGRLVLWNRNFLDVLSLPATLVERGARYGELLRGAARPLDAGSGRRTLDQWIGELSNRDGRPAPDLVVALGNGRRVRARAVRTPGGRIAVSFVDITALTAAEVARRDSERRAEVIVDNAIDVITLLAPDGTIRFESPSVTHVLGYTPEELVGRQVLDLIHPDDRPRAQAGMAQASALSNRGAAGRAAHPAQGRELAVPRGDRPQPERRAGDRRPVDQFARHHRAQGDAGGAPAQRAAVAPGDRQPAGADRLLLARAPAALREPGGGALVWPRGRAGGWPPGIRADAGVRIRQDRGLHRPRARRRMGARRAPRRLSRTAAADDRVRLHPRPRRRRHGARLHRAGKRGDREARARGASAAGAEDGGDRPAHRRHRP